MPIRVVILLVALIVAAAPPAAGAAGSVIQVRGVGLQTPESVLYDRNGDVYLVSNINGGPTATDNNGFISRVAPGGRVIALKWIQGGRNGAVLDAPKGTAIAGDTLYVADITAVRLFDRRTGRMRRSIAIRGATFLNDVAAGPGGAIYVTDSGLKPDFSPSGTDAVYRIDRRGTVTRVASGAALHHPNGVTVRPDGTVVVVTFSDPGEVYTLGPQGARRNVRRLRAANLDGVVPLPGGALLVSSWGASAVLRLGSAGQAVPVVRNVPSPADIGYDTRRNRVLIPVFNENRLLFQPLP